MDKSVRITSIIDNGDNNDIIVIDNNSVSILAIIDNGDKIDSLSSLMVIPIKR